MKLLLLLTLLGQARETNPSPDDITGSGGGRRSMGFRGLSSSTASSGTSYAFFEFAPANGAGMGSACAGTVPTGAKGEAMSFTRATAATCLRGFSDAVADGDLVLLSSGQPAVMAGNDPSGVLGILSEPARTNNCLRSAEICNAAWTNTATCVSDDAPGPFGTVTMDSLTDTDPGSAQGAEQTISTTSATRHAVSCFVKGGTADSARIVLAGTGSSTGDCTATVTGLLLTGSSKRIACVSSAAYGGSLTAVTLGVFVGDSATVTGSIYVEGCQHEADAATGWTSHIPTAGTAATRNLTVWDAPAAIATPTGLSLSATFVVPTSLYVGGGEAVPMVLGGGTLGSTSAPSPYFWLYSNTGGGRLAVDTSGVVSGGAASYAPFGSDFGNALVTVAAYHTGTLLNACQMGSCAAGTASTLGTPTFTRLALGRQSSNAATQLNGVIKRVCVDPDSSRCR